VNENSAILIFPPCTEGVVVYQFAESIRFTVLLYNWCVVAQW